jgi:molybdate transport system regulatory protein
MVVASPGSSIQEAARIQVGQRIWLHRAGRFAMGMGTFELLIRVELTGSLNQAAAAMGMAYSKAWQSVRRAEGTLGFALLERQTGGRGGGGSTLSPEGKWIVGAFGSLVEEATQAIEQLVNKYMGDWPATTGEGSSARPEDAATRGGGI